MKINQTSSQKVVLKAVQKFKTLLFISPLKKGYRFYKLVRKCLNVYKFINNCRKNIQLRQGKSVQMAVLSKNVHKLKLSFINCQIAKAKEAKQVIRIYLKQFVTLLGFKSTRLCKSSFYRVVRLIYLVKKFISISKSKLSSKKLLNIYNELLYTQKDYVHNLQFYIQNFQRPCRELNILSKDEIRLIFSNVHSIYKMHKELLARLQESMTDLNPLTYRVSQYFKYILPFFRLYFQYYSTYKEGNLLVENLISKNTKFKQLIENIKGQIYLHSLVDFYRSKPTQRLFKYQPLFKQILKKMKPWHIDRPELQLTLKNLLQIVQVVEKNYDYHRNLSFIFQLQSKVTEGFLQPSRQYIFSRSCRVFGYRIQNAEMHIFNNLALFITNSKEIMIHLDHKSWIELIVDLKYYRNICILVGSNQCCTVLFQNRSEQQLFAVKIGQILKELNQKRTRRVRCSIEHVAYNMKARVLFVQKCYRIKETIYCIEFQHLSVKYRKRRTLSQINQILQGQNFRSSRTSLDVNSQNINIINTWKNSSEIMEFRRISIQNCINSVLKKTTQTKETIQTILKKFQIPLEFLSSPQTNSLKEKVQPVQLLQFLHCDRVQKDLLDLSKQTVLFTVFLQGFLQNKPINLMIEKNASIRAAMNKLKEQLKLTYIQDFRLWVLQQSQWRILDFDQTVFPTAGQYQRKSQQNILSQAFKYTIGYLLQEELPLVTLRKLIYLPAIIGQDKLHQGDDGVNNENRLILLVNQQTIRLKKNKFIYLALDQRNRAVALAIFIYYCKEDQLDQTRIIQIIKQHFSFIEETYFQTIITLIAQFYLQIQKNQLQYKFIFRHFIRTLGDINWVEFPVRYKQKEAFIRVSSTVVIVQQDKEQAYFKIEGIKLQWWPYSLVLQDGSESLRVQTKHSFQIADTIALYEKIGIHKRLL